MDHVDRPPWLLFPSKKESYFKGTASSELADSLVLYNVSKIYSFFVALGLFKFYVYHISIGSVVS